MLLYIALLITTGATATATTTPTSETIVLALKHDKLGLAALKKRLYEVADPSSEDYGSWLSSEAVEKLVAPAGRVVSEAKAFVRAQCAGAGDISFEVTGQGGFLAATVAGEGADCVPRIARGTEWFRDAREAIEGAFHHRSSSSSPSPSSPSKKEVTATTSSSSSASRLVTTKAGLEPYGPPNAQRAAYGIPSNETGAVGETDRYPGQLQLVWGPGTFGYLPTDLATFYESYDVEGASIDHLRTVGYSGQVGGDNFGEATLDVSYASGLAPGVETLVANTNTDESTEETTGFGPALLAFSYLLANAGCEGKGALPLPAVVSMSLGSLSYDSCELLCTELAGDSTNDFSYLDCTDYMATQRQVCMFPWGEAHEALPTRVSDEFMKATARGVTLLAATGDGGSHFSFGAFPTTDPIGAALNDISCSYSLPTFPAESPYVLGVGGEQWDDGSAASGSDSGSEDERNRKLGRKQPGSRSGGVVAVGNASAEDPVYWYAGGAGFSRRFEMPPYQSDAAASYLEGHPEALPPSGSYEAGNRAYPDVVALAWGVPMVLNGSKITTGGTSASAPAFAGVVSLLNGRRLRAGLPTLGFLHPRLYSAAAAAASSGATTAAMFKDIVVGNSSVGGAGYQCGNGFEATTGWDAITGWGSPRWEGLVENLATDGHLRAAGTRR